MTYSAENRSPRFLRYLRMRFAVAGLCLGLAGGVAPAAEPDTLLALKAKASLATDPTLANLNLLVSVVDGVAVVGGPVPDAELPARVEANLKRVPGLSAVKVSCWVPAAEDPFAKMVGGKVAGSTAAVPAAPSAPRVPVLSPFGPAEPKPAAKPADRDAVVVLKPPAAGTSGFLLTPVAPGGEAVKSDPVPSPTAPTPLVPAPSYPTIPPPAVPTLPVSEPRPTPSPSVAQRVSEIRSQNPRFARLTVRLWEGTATIFGVGTPEAAWDYAAALREIPGIGRVVVGEVRDR